MDDKIAKYVIKSDWATQEQVQECLDYQEQIKRGGLTPPFLLDVLVQKQYISPSQRETLLKSMRKKGVRLFGEIAIDFQFVTYAQMQECLEIQEKIKKTGQENALGFPPYIGEILVSKNYMRSEEIKLILEAQKKEAASKENKALEKAVEELVIPQILSDSGTQDMIKLNFGTEKAVDQDNIPTADAPAKEPKEAKEMRTCKHCGSQFHISAKANEKKMRCGQCGKLVLGESASSKKDIGLAQKITLSLPKFGRTQVKKLSIPDYQLGDTLGEDSTGTTYQAVHLPDKNPVVIKVYNEETCADAKFMAQLSEAAHKCISLHIPNTRKTLKIQRAPKDNKEFIYLVSEYVEGKSLRQVIQQATPISVEKALTIITRLAKVLQYANEEGVIHGDIAPHNILISKEGKVIVANLGIPNKTVNNLSRIAQQDGMAPLYMAPELLDENRQPDYRSDIYSLGALFYYILARRPAFQGSSPFETLNRINDNIPVPAIQLYNKEVPLDVFRIIEKMMETEASLRYQNYQDLVNHLHDPHMVNQVVPLTEETEKMENDEPPEEKHKVERPEEDKGEKTLARVVATETYDTGEPEADDNLRTLSARNAGGGLEIPWNKIILIAILVMAVGIPLYFNMEKQRKVDQAAQEYYRLRDEFSRQRKSINTVDSLVQKMQLCNDLQKKFKSYRERHRDVPFAKEQNFLKNVEQHMKDIDRLKLSVVGGTVRNIIIKADGFLRKNQLCAALEVLTLDEIPEAYREPKMDVPLVNKRAEILKFAQSQFDKAQQQADAAYKEMTKSRDEQNFVVATEAQEKLQKAIAQLEKYIQDFTSEAKSRSAMSEMIDKTEANIAGWKQKNADYSKWIQEERPKKSQVAFQTIMSKIKPLLEKCDYAQAERELQVQLVSQGKSLFPELRDQLQQMKDNIGHLKTAREALLRHLSRLNTKNLKISYQGRIYSVESVSERGDFSLKPAKKLAWQDFPPNHLPLLIESVIPYATPDERFSLSFMCLELQNYPMAYKLLEEIAPQKEIAKKELQALESKLKTTTAELFSYLQHPDWDKNWEQSLTNALTLQNQYLLPGLPYTEEQGRMVHDFYTRAYEKMFGNECRQQYLFDFHNNENRLQQEGLQQAIVKIDNGYMVFSGGSWSYSEKNIRGVTGLCRFAKDNEKMEVSMGNYRMGIEATGKVSYYIYKPAKFQSADLGSFANKWFIFGLFLAENQMHWYINTKRQFSFVHAHQETIDKITFKASSSKEGGIALDDIYIGVDVK